MAMDEQIVFRHEWAAQRRQIGLRLLELDETSQCCNIPYCPRIRPGSRGGNIRLQPLDRLREVRDRFRRREHPGADKRRVGSDLPLK